MFFLELEPEPETLYAKHLHDYQVASGHHIVPFRALQQEKPGTIRDSTEIEDMGNISPVITTIEFGLGQFPEGMAIKIPTGSQLVIQQPTLNLRENEIITNDAMHVELIEEEEVEILASFFGLSNVGFEILPHSELTLEIDYEAPGENIRTVCQLENTSDSPVSFPNEMCATFGYYYPAIPGHESWLCDDRDQH